jgi:crotonobetainyl-CoA:carnitine CoA-transferase CaiB-like acyl-CoA transferase
LRWRCLTESQNRTTDESVETTGIPFVTVDGCPEVHGETPAVGEHTWAVLAELGYSEGRIDRMMPAGAARE